MVISEHEYFYASNGDVLRNKDDLLRFLRSVDEQTFHHHANSEKNDFANWTVDILKNKKIGKKLKRLHTPEEMADVIEDSTNRKEKRRTDKKSVIKQLMGAISGDD